MKKQWMQVGLFAVWGVAAHAAVQVENVAVQQIEGSKQVAIHYDVSSSHTNAVEVSVLLFDGPDQVALADLSGDVGQGIATGTGKGILWNAGADWNGRVNSQLRFWIVADDGTGSNPVPVPGSVLVLAGSNSGTDPDFGTYALMLDSGVFVDQGEVDKALWDEVYSWAVANGYGFDNSGNAESNDHPVVAVSWHDCVKWCNARSEKEGFAPGYEVGGAVYRTGNSTPVWVGTEGYRLPLVEEWQYMARGGAQDRRFPWGDSITHANANYFSVASSYDASPTRGYHPGYKDGWPGTNPATDFPGNGLGLYDMAGNVWEWCWDAAAEGRYMAGGSWSDAASSARCGALLGDAPANSRFTAGFRTVRSAAESLSGVASASVDTRDYTLSVFPTLGNPVPSEGTHTYAWRSTVTCSVDAVASDNGTNYSCTGWTGTGSVPATGTMIQTGAVVLDELASSVLWNWQAGSGGVFDSDNDLLPDDWELAHFGSITGAVATADADGDLQSNLDEYIAGTNPRNPLSLFQVTSQIETNGMHFVVEWTAVAGRVYNVYWSPSLGQAFQPLETGIPAPQHSYTDTVHSAESAGYYRVKVMLAIADTDGDGLPDDWERAHFGSVTGAVATADADGDLQSNLDEYIAGTNPRNPLSLFQVESHPEATGFVVEWTAVAGRVYNVYWSPSLGQAFQPLETGIHYPQASYTDTVHSAESPGYYRVEVMLAIADTDGDGLPDDWERIHFGSITGAMATADADGDLQSNMDEYIAGTNPRNPLSLFQTESHPEAAGFVVEWTAVAGRVYNVYWSPSLGQAFQPLETGIHYPQASYTDTVHSAESPGYYRVEVMLESYDADGDGMPNDWESQYAVFDAYTDADGDGASNLSEFIAGTDPTNDASFFTTTTSLVETNGTSCFVVEWNAIPDRIYTVRWRVDLMEDFQLLADGIEYPQNSYTNSLDTGTGFYRVDVRLK